MMPDNPTTSMLTALSAHAAPTLPYMLAANAISGATVMTAQIVYLHRPRRFACAYRIWYRIGRAFRVARYIVEGVGWISFAGLIVGQIL
jgi:hypothetical protein